MKLQERQHFILVGLNDVFSICQDYHWTVSSSFLFKIKSNTAQMDFFLKEIKEAKELQCNMLFKRVSPSGTLPNKKQGY